MKEQFTVNIIRTVCTSLSSYPAACLVTPTAVGQTIPMAPAKSTTNKWMPMFPNRLIQMIKLYFVR